MVPPVSWRFFLDEIQRWLVTVEGIADDSALDTVLAVQHALLPARDRTFPLELVTRARLRDVAPGHARGARRRPPTTGPTGCAPLRSFGPGTITVDDPHQICTTALDGSLTAIVHESSWDFDSPVSRPRQRGHDGDPATTKSQFETAGLDAMIATGEVT